VLAHLVDAVLPRVPVRQWMLTVSRGRRPRVGCPPPEGVDVFLVDLRLLHTTS